MIAPIHVLRPVVPERTAEEKAALDREHAILELLVASLAPHGLPDRYERDLMALGAEAVRRVLHQLDAASAAAVALNAAETTATVHVMTCPWCRRWRLLGRGGSFRCCVVFRRLSRSLDYLHQGYRRAARRIGGS